MHDSGNTDQPRNKLASARAGCERVARTCVCCGSARLHKSPAVLMPFVAHRALGWAPVVIDESWGLKTIRSGNAYTLCNSVWCAECGFLFLDIRFSDLEMAALYDDYRGEHYTALREHYEPGYRLRNQSLNAGVTYIAAIEEFLAPFVKVPVSLLDWGGDTGKNTPFRGKASRFDIHDISNKAVVEGARLVDHATACAGGYDLVVCSNVLEHVPYPAQLVLDMKGAMGPATVLYLEVPFEELVRTSPEGRDLHLKKRHWHEHVNFYSEHSLRRLLGWCGLEVLAFRELNAAGIGDASWVLQVAARRATEA